MITNFLINTFFLIINSLLNLLPEKEILPTAFTNAWNFIANSFANIVWTIPNGIQYLQPIKYLIYLIGVLIIYQIINWIIRKIPTIS